MQFLPILLLAFLSLFSGSLNSSSETSFTFGRNAVYRYARETTTGIHYYVQPDAHAMLNRDRSQLHDLERKVEQGWRRRLHTDCQYQMRQKQQMQQDAQQLNDEEKQRKAREYPLHSCDELRQRYNEQPGDYHEQRGGGQYRQYRQYRQGYRI